MLRDPADCPRHFHGHGPLPELGPARLDRELQRYIWKGKDHLSLKDLREYLNRYTYLPRLKDRSVLVRTVATAIGGMLPGPFAYAESWDEAAGTYRGLAIDNAANVHVVIDNESPIVRPDIAEAHRPRPRAEAHRPRPRVSTEDPGRGSPSLDNVPTPENDAGVVDDGQQTETKPTRFIGTVMISSERPARIIHQIVEAVVEQLTTLPGSEVTLKLEIDAEVPSGLDRARVRTLIENANTLGFIEKTIK